MPEFIQERLKPHLDEHGWTWSQFFEQAAQEWFEWYPDRPLEWRPHPSPSNTSKIHLSLPEDYLVKLDARIKTLGIAPKHSAYWSIVVHYMRVHDLFETRYDHTPSIIHTRLYQEDVNYLSWLVERGFFASQNDLCEVAIRTWLGTRRTLTREEAILEYRMRPSKEEGVRFTITIRRSLHEEVRLYSEVDGVAFSDIYYTALDEFLTSLRL